MSIIFPVSIRGFMSKVFILLVGWCASIQAMDVPNAIQDTNTPAQTIQNPEKKGKENVSDNVWNSVDPSDKPYQGENSPTWAWVLTDWGD